MAKHRLDSKLHKLKLDNTLSKLKRLQGKLSIQSLLFPKDKFTESQAKKWARDHGFKVMKVDVTENFIRLRQKSPSNFKNFRTKELEGSGGVKAIFVSKNASKFAGFLIMKHISKFSDSYHEILGPEDLKMPMEAELRIMRTGENRDGEVTLGELGDSLLEWSNLHIIGFHDMDDMVNVTIHKNSDRLGFVLNKPRIQIIDEVGWIVNDALITDRDAAWQIYQSEQMGRPLEISPEYKSSNIFLHGRTFQTNLNPQLITLLTNGQSGHLEGNSIESKAEAS